MLIFTEFIPYFGGTMNAARRTCLVLVLSGLLPLMGCGATAKFVYPAKASNLVQFSDKPLFPQKVAVVPFEELRDDRNEASTYFLYAVPLMPYGWATYERPDAARMFLTLRSFEFNVPEDLAKAAVTSIRKSGLFNDVFFTFGGEKSAAELVFLGQVISTKYEGSIYSYGLSIAGPLLWYLGLPAGSSINHLVVKFTLRETKSNKVLWEYAYTDRQKIVQGLYYRFGHDVRGYAALMERAMNAAVGDMKKSLSGKL